MRGWLIVAVIGLAGCASDKLAQSPPAGVDLSGHWLLNEADSDDPQRLAQSQFDAAVASQSSASSGRGGRGRAPSGYSGPTGPAMPSMTILADAMRWPGKQLELKQVAGVVAFSSGGYNRVCQPTDGARHHHRGADSQGRRAMPARGRDMPPSRCGWSDQTLIVQSAESDEEHPPFEEHYRLSEDGHRLIEVVDFLGGRSRGYTLSRVWDRVAQ